MLQVTKLYARSFDLDQLDVFWEIADFDGNIQQFDFYVLRSESSSGPFETLAGPFQDRYYFRDAKPLLLHKYRSLFYKLRIVDKVKDETAEFGPTTQQAEPDLIALDIIRQEDMLFREFIGRRCWLFPVRTFGARCTCFDISLGRRTRSNCVTCYDTSYLCGFFSPIEFFMQFDPSPKEIQLTPQMAQQPKNTSGRLISFPQLKPNDVIVESENKRWKVIRVPTTERLRSVVHQEPLLKLIEVGDIEYKLPINIADLTSLSPSAERNFTNPQHNDDETYNVDELLAVYGGAPRGTIR